jgi:hypothetical protein
MLVEVHPDSEQPWAVLFANEAWEQSVGVTRPRDGARVPFWDIFQVGLAGGAQPEQPCACAAAQHNMTCG